MFSAMSSSQKAMAVAVKFRLLQLLTPGVPLRLQLSLCLCLCVCPCLGLGDAQSLKAARQGQGNRRGPSPLPVFSVMSFGARGNGRSDDSAAIARAFSATCRAGHAAVLLFPRARIFLSRRALVFQGPCRTSPLYVKIDGVIQFDTFRRIPSKTNALLEVNRVNGVRITGPGKIHGKGSDWWGQEHRPNLLLISRSTNVRVSNITTVDPPRMHVNFQHSQQVQAEGITTWAPPDSRNTDSLHIGSCQDVVVSKCSLHSGDDCVSIVGNSRNVMVKRTACTAGHGFSIGSLGYGGATVCMSNITVRDSALSGTTNGARIKTYEGGRGLLQNVVFKNIRMYNVRHPITVNQFYCDIWPCPPSSNAVALKSIRFQRFSGTTSDPIGKLGGGVSLNCSSSVPCTGVTLDSVSIAPQQKGRGSGASLLPLVRNAYGTASHIQSPKGVHLVAQGYTAAQDRAIRAQAALCKASK